MKQQALPIEDTISLFDRICSIDVLKASFNEVRRNKGAAGIDGISVQQYSKDLDKELSTLAQELASWTYKPNSVRRVDIPKPNGGSRMLGIPCVRDRVVQTAIKRVLEPLFDPLFSSSSYGFRPGKNQRQAVEAAQRIVVEEKKEYVVDIDLSKFFDRVHHDRLISRLGTTVQDKRVLRLVGTILRSGVMSEGLVSASKEGVPQGGPLSPLLSNIVLDELDKELEKRGLSFCRFADDCNIFVKTQKAADRVMESISHFIEKRLKLVVNREKSKVGMTHLVKFLGMTIVRGTIAISRQSMNRAMQKVKELTPKGTNRTLEWTIEQINRWYVGWSNYYSMTQYPAQLVKIEAYTRRRLRSRIIAQHKRPRYLHRKLQLRGVSRKSADTVYSNKRRWAFSRAPAMHWAYPNSWFKEIGLETRSDEGRANWFDVNQWVKLT